MALEPVKLDDLTWGEMVTAIRHRIAAASDGKWTLHAPVDPGVTLLELFAWLLEQRIYWLDQVPDPFVRAALDLLGAEAPKPAQAAATVLTLSGQANPLRSFLAVSPMTEMRLLRHKPALIFSTTHETTVLPVERIELHIAGRDRTADLEQGRVLRLFPADGSAEEIKIVLWIRDAIPESAAGKSLALLFKLRVPSSIPPQWDPDAATSIPPPAQLSWWYRGSANGVPLVLKDIDDGTGGLRRSGVVRFSIPADWVPEETGGGKRYALWLRVEKATFVSPPRLEHLTVNVAIARHARPTEHHLKRQWLPLPGNVIALSELPENEPEKDNPPIENTVVLKIKERDNNWYDWTPKLDLSFYGSEDRVFVVNRAQGLLSFGDGLTGRLPVLAKTDDANLKVHYLVGGGTTGILGENREWEGGVHDADLRARNVVPTEGGAEPESIESARQRAATLLKRRERAITREDYEEIARTTRGVAIKRAHAAIGYHPDHPCTAVPGAVTVFVVPDAPREEVVDDWVESAFVAAPQPDPGARAAVLARLQEARLVTTEVFVRGPRYRPVALTVTVDGDPVDPMELRGQVHKRLQDFLDPLIGGDDQQGWPFGEPLRPSVLLRETQRAMANGEQAIAVSIRLMDTDRPAENCSDVDIGPHELVVLEEVAIRLNRKVASSGGLR